MTPSPLLDRSLRHLTRDGRAALTALLYRLPLIGPRLLLARLAATRRP